MLTAVLSVRKLISSLSQALNKRGIMKVNQLLTNAAYICPRETPLQSETFTQAFSTWNLSYLRRQELLPLKS
jgi:hypothetical protein